ncbi:MAG: single-stranded-DNA-specific exonuclease RecJ [Balneolaceae bacterium]
MFYRWAYSNPKQEKIISYLQQELNVPEQIAHLLVIRGIDSFESAKNFFRASLSDLYDPFLMTDMEAAAQRICEAVRHSDKVLVYGDYDVDGTTATACIYTFLRDFGVDVEYYIPHRFKEGYGINKEGIEYADKINADLVVSVDCGITAFEEAKMAREKGIDLVICDHHTVDENIPEAIAVLDPKRPDCQYPYDGLSGAGVAFKLIQASLTKLGLKQSLAYKFLDLVAISIASDIVPIIDENRVLMKEGLHMINANPRTGFKALLEVIKVPAGNVSTSTIVFSVGPRINAAGRMGDASAAVELMITSDENKARSFAHELEAINIRRRDTDSKTMEEALEKIDKEYNLDETASMVLHDSNWHLGVIGIVASRIVDLYYRPAILLSTVDGLVKGSARSIKGFNIYEALKKCEDLLIQFGGHEFAAGLTMEQKHLPEFRRRMNEIAFRVLSENDFKPELIIDDDIDLSHINKKFWKLLIQFEPFGPGNHRPVFVSRDVCVEGVPTIVGNGHLKMKVSQNGSGVFDVIGFNMHEFLPLLRNCKQNKIDIAYVLEENFWNNRRSIQMRLKDIQINERNESF